MTDASQLRHSLMALDGKPYGMLKSIKGRYRFARFDMQIDHIQGDPFAEASRLRIFIPVATHAFSEELYRCKSREVGFRDALTRYFASAAKNASKICGSGKSGLIEIDVPGQEVIERSSVLVRPGHLLECRFTVGMPAEGRRILGLEAARILCDVVPELVEQSFVSGNLPLMLLRKAVEVNEDADWLRKELLGRGLVAFVADGALLPRASGVDDYPLSEDARPFISPTSLRAEFRLPNAGLITGMGIPHGITLIVGGGYHGKSTLLRAIERGVYNHVPGDGREYVVTEAAAVKIRSEDGRQVTNVSISPFISNLPFGRDTYQFFTTNASGSTSQAAAIVEALEAGARTFLIDEDTSATNFMIRDRRMQELIVKEKEPITPFTDKVRQIWLDFGVSTIMVMGGSGDYFDEADLVIAMENYEPENVTAEAKAIAANHQTGRRSEGGQVFGPLVRRLPLAVSFKATLGKRDVSIRVRRTDEIEFGKERIKLNAVEQLVHASQLRSIAQALLWLGSIADGEMDVTTLLQHAAARQSEMGPDAFSDIPAGNLSVFRPLELAAALNRLRSLKMRKL